LGRYYGPNATRILTASTPNRPCRSAPRWRTARINYAAELNDASVAGALHHAAMMHGNGRGGQIAPERAQISQASNPRRHRRACCSRLHPPQEWPSFRVSAMAAFTTRETSTVTLGPDRLFRLNDHCSRRANQGAIIMSGVGYGALAWKSTRPHFREKEIEDAVLASLTHQTLKELGVAAVGHRLKLLNAISFVRTDAKAKAALAILPEFDKALGRRKDGPAHPDHLDEAACRTP
jgi:hypothetical protein